MGADCDQTEDLAVEVQSSRVVASVVVMDVPYLVLASVHPPFAVSCFVTASHPDTVSHCWEDLVVSDCAMWQVGEVQVVDDFHVKLMVSHLML